MAADSIPSTLRRTAGRIVREARLYPKALRSTSGKRVAFFPSSGREQSGLLRAYGIAEELEHLGWSTLVVPKHLSLVQRDRVLRLYKPDVVVLQTCRHPLNRIEHFGGFRVVLDLDDADFFDPDLTAVMEAMATGAAGVICGSRFIRDWANRFNENTCVVWTGTPISAGPWPDHRDRQRIVTWAQSDPIGYDREFQFVRDVLLKCAAQVKGSFTLRLYGWHGDEDHPYLRPLRKAGLGIELIGMLPYDDFLASLRDTAVGLSPLLSVTDFNKGKSFGKILGYLDAKVPVIASDEADNALFFRDESGVVSNDADVWVQTIRTLLDDPARRSALADAAYVDFTRRLSIPVAAARVGDFLDRTLTHPTPLSFPRRAN